MTMEDKKSLMKEKIEILLNDLSYKEKVDEFSADMKALGGAKASASALIAFLEKQ